MSRFLKIALVAVLILSSFFGCSKKKNKIQTSFAIPENSFPVEDDSPEKVDFDFTKMNANMVYAQVFEMMIEPEKYQNKKIKMRGNFEIFKNTAEVQKIAGSPESYSVIISDALACCQQGISFHYDFKDGAPAKGSEIIVTGTFIMSELDSGIGYNFVQAESVVESL